MGKKLAKYADLPDVTVLGLPRGGVPVAYEVAQRLHAPLDVFVVRKLGVPGSEELAMGAIATGGTRVLNGQILKMMEIPDEAIEAAFDRERRELERRESAYRGDRPPVVVAGRTVIVVDDGIATGSTMRAAIAGLRQLNPAYIVVAAPTAARDTVRNMRGEADEFVTLMTPADFYFIGEWYQNFKPVTDEEVGALLQRREKELIAA